MFFVCNGAVALYTALFTLLGDVGVLQWLRRVYLDRRDVRRGVLDAHAAQEQAARRDDQRTDGGTRCGYGPRRRASVATAPSSAGQSSSRAASAVARPSREAGGARWAVESRRHVSSSRPRCSVVGPRGRPRARAAPDARDGAGSAAIDGVIRIGEPRRRARGAASFGERLAAARGIARAKSRSTRSSSSTRRGPRARRRRCAGGSTTSKPSSQCSSRLWGAGLGACRVYSTVSHRHVYGMLFRVLVAAAESAAVRDLRSRVPGAADRQQRRRAGARIEPGVAEAYRASAGRRRLRGARCSPPAGCLPATRQRTRRACSARARSKCSAAPRRAASHGASRREPTATRLDGDADGRDSRADADELLEVRSPFTGQPDWLQMGDLVRS